MHNLAHWSCWGFASWKHSLPAIPILSVQWNLVAKGETDKSESKLQKGNSLSKCLCICWQDTEAKITRTAVQMERGSQELIASLRRKDECRSGMGQRKWTSLVRVERVKQDNTSLIVLVRSKCSLALCTKYTGGTRLPRLDAVRERTKEKQNQVHCAHNAKTSDSNFRAGSPLLTLRVLSRVLLLSPF